MGGGVFSANPDVSVPSLILQILQFGSERRPEGAKDGLVNRGGRTISALL